MLGAVCRTPVRFLVVQLSHGTFGLARQFKHASKEHFDRAHALRIATYRTHRNAVALHARTRRRPSTPSPQSDQESIPFSFDEARRKMHAAQRKLSLRYSRQRDQPKT